MLFALWVGIVICDTKWVEVWVGGYRQGFTFSGDKKCISYGTLLQTDKLIAKSGILLSAKGPISKEGQMFWAYKR